MAKAGAEAMNALDAVGDPLESADMPLRIRRIAPKHPVTGRSFLFAFACLVFGMSLNAGAAMRVVIDAGHGGHDRGADNGLVYEKHLAFDVARRVEAILKAQGVKTVMTRERDVFIPLSKRADISNSYRDAVFVSVHFNSASSRSATGLETFYYGTNKDSHALARLVQSALLYKTRKTDRGVKYRQLYVLSHNKRPAILVECGFLSTSSELRNCLDPRYRQKIAEGIAMGVIRFGRGGKVR